MPINRPLTQKLTTDIFVERSNIAHKNFYTYPNTVYITAKIKVIVTCPLHGDFQTLPHNHMKGVKCPRCTNSVVPTTEEFIAKAKTIHNDFYDYSKTQYTRGLDNICITCSVHGDFEQRAQHHLDGSGCPSCAEYGFNPNKPAYLYYLKVVKDNQILYKIGVTNRTIEERFRKDVQFIEVLKLKLYARGSDAWLWEREFLTKYKEYKYIGPNVLKDGNSELFTADILQMYEKEQNELTN